MTRQRGQGTGRSRTHPVQIAAVERQRQAVQLRLAGATYAQIAEKLGYRQAAGALKAVEAALAKTLREPTDQLRELELARLDALWLSIWPQAQQGSLGAVDRCLRIQERRARLLGLDAPKELAVDLALNRDYAAQLAAQYGLNVDEVIAEAEHFMQLQTGLR